MYMDIFLMITTGLLGIIIGSFLNVIILRINTGRGIQGRSMCFSCNKTLAWYELIPIVSYALQKGKCRSCRTSLSAQYPIVELTTGVLFAGVAMVLSPLYNPLFFIISLVWVSVGMIIATYDWLHKTLPEKPLIIFFLLSLIMGMHGWGMVIVPLPFLVLWIISRGKWIGFGDIELMACAGVLLGTMGGFSATVLSFWIACMVIVPWYLIMKLRKKKVSHEIPFGPFLLLGMYLVGIMGFDVFRIIMGMVV